MAAEALDLVQRQTLTAVDFAAKVALGGKRLDRRGYFLEPTILTDIEPENPAYYQEFFAPVALIFRVKGRAGGDQTGQRLSVWPWRVGNYRGY